jgi:perosamine synthetase
VKTSARTIPLCAPGLSGPSGQEWAYVRECLESGWVSSAGPFVERFEERFARRIGRRHAVAVASGTAALHLSLLAAGVREADEVLVSTLTFVAPVNAIRYVRAWPVLIDAEPRYWQMDVGKLHDFLERECSPARGGPVNRTSGRRIRAVLPVHILGHPCDMDPILELARRFDLVVIEDATESLGATYRDRPVGAHGNLACFSFNGNKVITTGGGGMVVTDDAALASRVRYLSTQARDDPVEYHHHEIGFNYRLSGLQAALGCAQLERLDAHVAAKQRIAGRYARGLAGVEALTPIGEAPWAGSAWWLYSVLVDPRPAAAIDSRALMRALDGRGIESRPLWQPGHRSPAHRGCQAYRCEVADRIYRRALSLPSSVGMTAGQQRRVLEAIRGALAGAAPVRRSTRPRAPGATRASDAPES